MQVVSDNNNINGSSWRAFVNWRLFGNKTNNFTGCCWTDFMDSLPHVNINKSLQFGEIYDELPVTPLPELERGIISDDLQHYFDLYILCIACVCLSFFGICTNIINITVFIRQGLKDSVTRSLLSLSLSDLGGTLFTFLYGLCFIPKESNYLVNEVDWSAVMYIWFAWPRGAFLDISTLTTLYISVERCLCVVIPLRIKGMLTTSRATKILFILYIIILSCYTPLFASHGLKWQESDTTNITRLTLWFAPGRSEIEAFSNIATGIILPTASYIIVIVCTYLMIRGLRHSSGFRNKVSSGVVSSRDRPSDVSENDHEHEHSDIGKKGVDDPGGASALATATRPKLTNKEQKVVKLVVLVAFVFIACTLPKVILIYGRRFIPGFNVDQVNRNLHATLFGIIYLIEDLNASVNTFIYLTASSRYKAVFLQTFCRRSDHSSNS